MRASGVDLEWESNSWSQMCHDHIKSESHLHSFFQKNGIYIQKWALLQTDLAALAEIKQRTRYSFFCGVLKHYSS